MIYVKKNIIQLLEKDLLLFRFQMSFSNFIKHIYKKIIINFFLIIYKKPIIKAKSKNSNQLIKTIKLDDKIYALK